VAGLADGVLSAVASPITLPLDAEERLLPIDQRRPRSLPAIATSCRLSGRAGVGHG